MVQVVHYVESGTQMCSLPGVVLHQLCPTTFIPHSELGERFLRIIHVPQSAIEKRRRCGMSVGKPMQQTLTRSVGPACSSDRGHASCRPYGAPDVIFWGCRVLQTCRPYGPPDSEAWRGSLPRRSPAKRDQGGRQPGRRGEKTPGTGAVPGVITRSVLSPRLRCRRLKLPHQALLLPREPPPRSPLRPPPRPVPGASLRHEDSPHWSWARPGADT